MKTKILSLVLTIVMLLGVMPLAVSAEETQSVSKIELTVGDPIASPITGLEAARYFANSSNVTHTADSHVTRGTSYSYSNVYEKVGDVFQEVPYEDYLDPAKAGNYYVANDLTVKSGYTFSEAQRAGDLTGVTMTINGVNVPLAVAGVDYKVNNDWSDRNISVLIPISYYGGITADPVVKKITATPTKASVQKGTSYTFSATVEAFNGASNAVTWTFREGFEPTDPNTTLVNGVLTVGEAETRNNTFLYATSAFDNTKKAEIYVIITDEAPTFDNYGFSVDSIHGYVGKTTDTMYLTISGTEQDDRTIFTLTGGNKANTKISYINSGTPGAQITIDSEETAETLTLTAQSVAHPEITDTLTIEVRQLPVVGNDIYFNLDFDTLNFDPSKTEGDVDTQILDNLTIDSTLSPNIEIDYGNSGLLWVNGGSPNGIGYGSESVDLSKTYLLEVNLSGSDVYTWSDKIKTEDFSDLNVYLNGVKCEVFEFSYSDYWDDLDLYLIPAWFDAEFTGASLTLGTDLSLSYYVKVNDADDIDVAKMAVQFTMNEKTTLVKDHKIVDGEYVFTFKNIAPNDMMDLIDASLVILADDGETVERVIKKKDDYSVTAYITKLKNEAPDEKTLTLLRDLVWYCDRAERYADGSNTIYNHFSGIFTANDLMPAEADNAFSLDHALATGSRLTAAGVFFSSDNRIYVKINAEEAVKLVVKKAGVTVDEISFGAGTHTYYTSGILATEFDDVYTFELYVGESATAAQTLTYSIYTYAYRMKDHTDHGAISHMAELARALYRYGKSAEAYIAG